MPERSLMLGVALIRIVSPLLGMYPVNIYMYIWLTAKGSGVGVDFRQSLSVQAVANPSKHRKLWPMPASAALYFAGEALIIPLRHLSRFTKTDDK